MVTRFFLNIFLLEDERPYAADYPERLHHDLRAQPNWINPLPETPQTCGPGEADGLYFYGRPHYSLQLSAREQHSRPATFISWFVYINRSPRLVLYQEAAWRYKADLTLPEQFDLLLVDK